MTITAAETIHIQRKRGSKGRRAPLAVGDPPEAKKIDSAFEEWRQQWIAALRSQ